MDGAVRRVGDGRVLPVRRQARALYVRRPLQARRRVSPDVAAAAAPSGTRGLPGRRLLPPLAPARACLQALGRPRRRLPHGAAGDRDAGRRRGGLHPDERHLHHRRPDLPRVRPLLLRRSAGDQRRRLGVARGRQRSGAGDAPGGRAAEARPLAVPRAGGLRPVRLGARPGHARRARPWGTDGRDSQPAAVLALGPRGAGGGDLRRGQRVPRRDPGRGRRAVPGRGAGAPAVGGLDLRRDQGQEGALGRALRSSCTPS